MSALSKKAELKKSFKFHSASAFLTYPRCPAPKDSLMDFLKSKGAVKAIVAQEEHKEKVVEEYENDTGTDLHLHCYVAFKKKIKTSFSGYFNLEYDGQTYHPNIQSPKDVTAVVSYVIKDGDYITLDFDIPSFFANKKNKKKYLGTELMNHPENWGKIVKANPEMVFSFTTIKRNLDAYTSFITAAEKEQNNHLMRYSECQKKHHYWICGPSNSGKSYFWNQIMKGYEYDFYQIPSNNDYCQYAGQQFLYYDEFKGQITIQQLNLWCGGGCKVNVKCSSTEISKFTQVYICSNYSISQCYDKADIAIINTWYNRFITVVMDPEHPGDAFYAEYGKITYMIDEDEKKWKIQRLVNAVRIYCLKRKPLNKVFI
jgi:hypothetical protein